VEIFKIEETFRDKFKSKNGCFCVDIDIPPIDIMWNKYNNIVKIQELIKNSTFMQFDINSHRIPFPDNSVTEIMSIHNIGRGNIYSFGEIARVLTKDGKLIVRNANASVFEGLISIFEDIFVQRKQLNNSNINNSELTFECTGVNPLDLSFI